MFRGVENQNVAAHGLGGNDELVVGHKPCAVHLAVVINLDDNLDVPNALLPQAEASAAAFGLAVLELAGINLAVGEWEFQFCDHQMVLLAVGGVGAEQQSLLGYFRIVVDNDFVRPPLARQTRPFQSVRHDQIIQEGSVLLPDLVLIVDESLLLR